ncbi:class I tRNA ligase family protein [Candidatus Bathyarchaeota archaeon]|nr:class I tRNA ligase family protein [Candidatus Bathyarchaeota archaeon]
MGILGNFIYRSLLFAYRNYGKVPSGFIEPEIEGAVKKAIEAITVYVQNYEFKKICDTLLGLAITGNKYLQEREPWKLKETDPDEARDVIHNALWLSRAIAILGEPVFPFHAYEVYRQLGLDGNSYSLDEALRAVNIGRKLTKPRPLFNQLSEERLQELEATLSRRISMASGNSS